MEGRALTELLRIARLGEEAVERYGTRNPFSLAEKMGVNVLVRQDFQKLKGMYKVILGQRFVFLNGKMRRREAREVLAHELGHDALHRDMAKDSVVQDHFILDMTLKPEYEANLFASSLLFSDEQILELLQEGNTVDQVARILGQSEKLLELKIRILQEKGLLSR